MDPDEEITTRGFFKQDYGQIMFNLSRWSGSLADGNAVTVEIERAWAGDVAGYITELENIVRNYRGGEL